MQSMIGANHRPRRLPLLRGTIPITVSLGILWFLRENIIHFDLNVIAEAALRYSVSTWLVAAVFTIVSFYAVAQYDRLMAAHMQLGVPGKALLASGWRATAIAQVLGYGLVTGPLVRWRALGHASNLSLWDCSRLTAGVTMSFFAGWAVVASASIILFPQDKFQGLPTMLAVTGFCAAVLVILGSFAPPIKWATHIPTPRIILPVIAYTALDTLAASFVLFVFLPDGYIPFFVLYTAFLFALTAGMASGLPGGLGAFELCLLSILTPSDPAPLLAAVLAFRMIYYAAPALIAGASLLKVSSHIEALPLALTASRALQPSLSRWGPPEADLTAQGLLSFQSDGTNGAALWHRSRNTDIVLGDPFGPKVNSTFLEALTEHAKSNGRGFCLYKCSERAFEHLNLRTIKIGSEAVIKPHDFDVSGSSRRQLRRKLRKAKKAQITISETNCGYGNLQEIDQEWQTQHGAARGFSMGRLSPELLSRQRLFVAYQQDRAVAFVTFLISSERWTIDIMRMRKDCPDGAVHLAICTAIDCARDEGIKDLSLAAAPGYFEHPPAKPLEKLVHSVFQHNSTLQGLTQFKAGFGPEWQPRYCAGSSWTALFFGAFDIARLIHHPPEKEARTANVTHNDYGFYEIDSSCLPCHALPRMTSKDGNHEFGHSPHQCIERPSS